MAGEQVKHVYRAASGYLCNMDYYWHFCIRAALSPYPDGRLRTVEAVWHYDNQEMLDANFERCEALDPADRNALEWPTFRRGHEHWPHRNWRGNGGVLLPRVDPVE